MSATERGDDNPSDKVGNTLLHEATVLKYNCKYPIENCLAK